MPSLPVSTVTWASRGFAETDKMFSLSSPKRSIGEPEREGGGAHRKYCLFLCKNEPPRFHRVYYFSIYADIFSRDSFKYKILFASLIFLLVQHFRLFEYFLICRPNNFMRRPLNRAHFIVEFSPGHLSLTSVTSTRCLPQHSVIKRCQSTIWIWYRQ
jgi:hypothetical protein